MLLHSWIMPGFNASPGAINTKNFLSLKQNGTDALLQWENSTTRCFLRQNKQLTKLHQPDFIFNSGHVEVEEKVISIAKLVVIIFISLCDSGFRMRKYLQKLPTSYLTVQQNTGPQECSSTLWGSTFPLKWTKKYPHAKKKKKKKNPGPSVFS